jgi:hypothetical protein
LPLNYTWELLTESIYTKSGGDLEIKPEAIPIKVKKTADHTFTFNAPFQRGAYRLFIYIHDQDKQVAYANFPFMVK